jgi:hypothetical protein
MIQIVSNDHRNDVLGKILQFIYPHDIRHGSTTDEDMTNVCINMLDTFDTYDITHIIDDWGISDIEGVNMHIVCRSDISKKMIQICHILNMKYDVFDIDKEFVETHKRNVTTQIELGRDAYILETFINLYYPNRYDFRFIDDPRSFRRYDNGYVLRTLIYTAC